MAAAFFSVGVAAAQTDTLGDAAISVGDFTYAPIDDSGLETVMAAAPFSQFASGPVEFAIGDSAGNQLATFTSDTFVTNVLGNTTTQFTVNVADQDFQTGQIVAALQEAGLSDDSFTGDTTLEDFADALAGSDLDYTGGELTGEQIVDFANANGIDIDVLDAGNAADALNDYEFFGTDAWADFLGEDGLGLTDADFAGDATVEDAAAALANNLDASDIAAGNVDADAITAALGDIEFADDSDAAAGTIADGLGDNAGEFVNADTIEDALGDAGFSDASLEGDGTLSDLAGAFAGDENIIDGIVAGNVDADLIGSALEDTDLSFTDIDGVAGNIADAINDYDFTAPEGMPVDGTQYSVADIGFGLQTIYEAVPDGQDGFDTSTTLVTPFFGDYDISWLTDLLGYDPLGLDAADAFTPRGLFPGFDFPDFDFGGSEDVGGGDVDVPDVDLGGSEDGVGDVAAEIAGAI